MRRAKLPPRCPTCGHPLTQGPRRICSQCGEPIRNHHKWYIGPDGRLAHKNCDEPLKGFTVPEPVGDQLPITEAE